MGSSITHTQMCECHGCEDAACCTETQEPEEKICGDSYDFTQNAHCGLQVESCASRCSTHVWRIPLTEDCNQTRPHDCCDA
jgi:hypothetical protein